MGGIFIKKVLVVSVTVLFLLTGLSSVDAGSAFNKSAPTDDEPVETAIPTIEKITERESILDKYDLSKMPFKHLNDRIRKPTLIDGEDWDIVVPDDYSSIQEAVNNAGLQNGYRIYVRTGTYNENIIIETNGIMLNGENKNNTIINGKQKDHVIQIKSDYNILSNFTIINSDTKEYGIKIDTANGNIIKECIITRNHDGIIICYNSHGNNITKNTIHDNTANGIILTNISTGNTIHDNIISTNLQSGITITNVSRGNQITYNTIKDNNIGIKCTGVSDGNVYFLNSLINNDLNSFDSSDDYWDNGNIGNYWSDYSGIDADGNGIGDTPYNIPSGDNKDNYPLMGQPLQSSLYNQDYDNIKNPNMENDGFNNQGDSFSLDYIIVPDDYPTIQSAIDNASDGDTVFVRAGTYYENLVVDKKLKIAGNGAGLTIIDGLGKDDHVVNIDSDYVEISDFTVRNCSIGYSGIRIYGDNCNIHDNVMLDCGGGIELWSINNTKIINNACKNSAWGIYVHISDHCLIKDNVITHNIYGIEMGISSVNISCCDIENNSLQGVLCLWSSDSIFENNSISSNGDIGIQMFNSNNNIVEYNIFRSNYAGIDIYKSSYTILRENFIHDFNDSGISLFFQSKFNKILKNVIKNKEIKFIYHIIGKYWEILNPKDTPVGILIDLSSNNDISFNIIENIQGLFADGIYLIGSNNIISNNNIKNTKGILLGAFGITLYGNSNIIANNTISDTKGTLVSFCISSRGSYNIISNNTISDTKGILSGAIGICSSGSYNIISNNTISDTKGILSGAIGICSSGSYNIVTNNTISDTSGLLLIGTGISIDNSCNSNISYNKISNTKGYLGSVGIYLGNVSNNKILFNNITHTIGIASGYGLYTVDYCFNNTISSNTISHTKGIFRKEGINMDASCDGNIIFYNNFFNNPTYGPYHNNAYDQDDSRWDNGFEGNYWDDYTGTDSNNDGIGDTPYDIPGGDNKDNYPLMEPYNIGG